MFFGKNGAIMGSQKRSKEDSRMDTEELKARKKALGYTNKMISELSGVPLGTVNKIFSGATDAPRYDTLRAIEDVLKARKYIKERGKFVYNWPGMDTSTLCVEESVLSTFYKTDKHPGEFTGEDFYSMPEDRRMELIEGFFYEMGSPTVVHQAIVFEVSLLFRNCVDAHPEKDCEVFVSPLAVKLCPDDKTYVMPDIIVVCDREQLSDLQHITGAPALLVEVLSPSNRDHDIDFKYKIYRKYGIKEYWIIDPDRYEVLVHDLTNSFFPKIYTFDDEVPVGISGGECSIDFRRVKARLERLRR